MSYENIDELTSFFDKKYDVRCIVKNIDGRIIVGVNEFTDEYGATYGDILSDMDIMEDSCNYKELDGLKEFTYLESIFDSWNEYDWAFYEVPVTLI